MDALQHKHGCRKREAQVLKVSSLPFHVSFKRTVNKTCPECWQHEALAKQGEIFKLTKFPTNTANHHPSCRFLAEAEMSAGNFPSFRLPKGGIGIYIYIYRYNITHPPAAHAHLYVYEYTCMNMYMYGCVYLSGPTCASDSKTVKQRPKAFKDSPQGHYFTYFWGPG